MGFQLERAFALETVKREIEACQSLDDLKDVTLSLLLQNEILKEMIGEQLRQGQ